MLVCFAEGFEEELEELEQDLQHQIRNFRKRLEKITSFEASLLIDPVKPYGKRRFQKFRLITREVSTHGQRVLIFCKIFKRADPTYLNFLRKSRSLAGEDSLLRTAASYAERNASKAEKDIKVLPHAMQEWLLPLLELRTAATEEEYDIHETRQWISQVREVFIDAGRGTQLLHQVVQGIIFSLVDGHEATRPEIGVVQVNQMPGCYVVWGLRDARTVSLLAASVNTPTEAEIESAYQSLRSDNYKAEIRKAYWSDATLDETLWRDIEQSDEGNLFLSHDELSLLERLSGVGAYAQVDGKVISGDHQGMPALISGRAGTGKSTMLAYVFASLMLKQAKGNLDGRPVYVTYNSRLLEQARKTVRGLLRSNAVFRREGHVEVRERLEASLKRLEDDYVLSFHDLLRKYVVPEEMHEFEDARHVDFSDFKSSYLGSRTLLAPFTDYSFRKKVSPERAWYIIRQFIKGSGYEVDASPDEEQEIVDAHGELTESDREGVTAEDVLEVYQRVYRPWYRKEITEGDLWDDQDLVQRALAGLQESDRDGAKTSQNDRSKISAIVCDEAQDFTPREIRFLVRCCDLLRYELQSFEHLSIPIVLAGDSLQTLSPTGFRWSAVRAILYEEIWAACGKDCPPETLTLSHNYRSRDSIVRFCNLIQMHRKQMFPYREDSREIKPQNAWDSSPSEPPLYFKVGYNITVENIQEIATSRIMLLPCEQDGESEYIKNDPALSHLLEGKSADEVTATVMSSSAAKGQEFPQVFLYNFGKYLREAGFDMSVSSGESPEDFAREFFFNKLYVAASRACQRLFIIENDLNGDVTGEHLGLLWRDMIRTETDEARPSKQPIRFTSAYPEFSQQVVVAEFGNDKDWSDTPTDITPERADAAFKAGRESRDEAMLRRAAAIYDQLGSAYEKKAHEARAEACRVVGNYVLAYESFVRAGNYRESWSVAIEGQLWSSAAKLLGFNTLTPPNFEVSLVRMMMSQSDDMKAIHDLCVAVSVAVNHGLFKMTRTWLRAQEEISSRVQRLIGDDVVAREPTPVGITLSELRDAMRGISYGATALSGLRATVGDIYFVQRAWSEALREYSEAPKISEIQRLRMAYSKAEQSTFPSGLSILTDESMFNEIIDVWTNNGSPHTDEWYRAVESALLRKGDHARRVFFALDMRNIPHALTSLNSPEFRESPRRPSALLRFVQLAASNFYFYAQAKAAIDEVSNSKNDEVLRNQLIEQLVIEAVRRWERPSDFELNFQPFEFWSDDSVPFAARNVVYHVMKKYNRNLGTQVLDPRWHGRALEFANDWESAWTFYDEYTPGDVPKSIRNFCRAGYLRSVHRWAEAAGAARGRSGFSTAAREEANVKMLVAKEWKLVGKQAQSRGHLYDDDLCKDRDYPLADVPPLIGQGAEDYQESGQYVDFTWQTRDKRTFLSYYTNDGLLAWVIDPREHGSVTEANGPVLQRRKDGLFEIVVDKWKIEVRFGRDETRVTIKPKAETDNEERELEETSFRVRR